MINEAESLSISCADYVWILCKQCEYSDWYRYWHSSIQNSLFHIWQSIYYELCNWTLATDNLATLSNMARARPWLWQQHLALATRLKAGILALGPGALQGCRRNALNIVQNDAALCHQWKHRPSSTAMAQCWCWMLLPSLVVAQYHLQPAIHRSQVIVAIGQLIITAPIHLVCSTAVRLRILGIFQFVLVL